MNFSLISAILNFESWSPKIYWACAMKCLQLLVTYIYLKVGRLAINLKLICHKVNISCFPQGGKRQKKRTRKFNLKLTCHEVNISCSPLGKKGRKEISFDELTSLECSIIYQPIYYSPDVNYCHFLLILALKRPLQCTMHNAQCTISYIYLLISQILTSATRINAPK